MLACAVLILVLAQPLWLGRAAALPEDKAATANHINEVLRNLTQQAQADFQNGDYQKARAKLRQALNFAPSDPGLWRYLGLTDVQLNDFDAAVVDFRKTLLLSPKDAPSYFDLGRLYQLKHDNALAMETYRHGLTLAPDDLTANQNLAFLLVNGGKFRDAIVPLRKLRMLDDSDLPTRATLIECYLKEGMDEQGKQEIQAYLAAPNASAEDKLKLAKLLVADKFLDFAQLILTSELQLAADSPEAHDLQGTLLLKRNQYENASKEFRLAVQLAPTSPEFSMDLTDALILGKRFQDAFEFLQSTQNQFGERLDFRFKLGVILYGTGHYLEAISVFKKLDQQEPNLELIQYYLGNSYSENGELDAAQTYYKKAIALDPNQASYYAALAKVLRKEGDSKTDEAIFNLQKALRLDSSDTTSKQELAICYERKHDYAKAEKLLQEVVLQMPNLVPAHVALSRIYYQDRKKNEGDAEKEIILHLEEQKEPTASPQ